MSPPKVWNNGEGEINNKKVIEPLFGDSQTLTSSGKPCVRPLKKLPYKVYIFLVFYESKKYFKGTVEVFKDIFLTILLQTEHKLKLSGTIPLGA